GAHTTVDALIGIDVVLVVVIIGMNAVDGAHLDTRLVLHVDARFADHIRHSATAFLSVLGGRALYCSGAGDAFPRACAIRLWAAVWRARCLALRAWQRRRRAGHYGATESYDTSKDDPALGRIRSGPE